MEFNLYFRAIQYLNSLADPDQRIYEFRGANPARIKLFIEAYNPHLFDFGVENNRSNGTDIVRFGNDLLSHINKNKVYKNVQYILYSPLYDKMTKHLELKINLLKVCKRLNQEMGKDWSIAILVPSNKLMIEVSDYLTNSQQFKEGKGLPPIKHEVFVESAGPSLAAILVAYMLESGSIKQCNVEKIIELLCEHICGRNGSSRCNKSDETLVVALQNSLETGKYRGKNRQHLYEECAKLAETCNSITFTGNVISDWLQVRGLFDSCTDIHLIKVFNDAKYLRLLRKGSQLFSMLNNLWKENENYLNATSAISSALTQEHFALASHTWKGINVMTIHKSKGKEFDEVIIYEGVFDGKIVSSPERIVQSTLNLRVATTRAKRNVTILTPNNNPCLLL